MPVSVAVLDALNSLLEAEQNSIFRFMGEGSPYLGRATAEIRRPLQQMVDTSHSNARDLHDLIDRLGGMPTPRRIQPEEQYLAYLSLKFLLPKLLEAKELTIRRYENALRALKSAPSEVIGLLEAHLNVHREQLAVLQKAAATVATTK